MSGQESNPGPALWEASVLLPNLDQLRGNPLNRMIWVQWFQYIVRGPRWQSGNTLASHL